MVPSRSRRSRPLCVMLFAGSLALGATLPRLAMAAEPVQYPPASCTRAESADASRAAFVRGKTASDQSSYDEALTQLALAYKLDCTRHPFLAAIAQVLERQANYGEAIHALELYLSRVPDLPANERTTIETKIKNLREEEKRKKAAAEAAPPPPPPKPQVIVLREHTFGPWVVVGAGVAAVATGVVLHVVAPALPAGCDAASQKCAPNAPQDVKDKAGLSQNLPLAGTVTLIGGGVLVAGGLLWHFLEPTGPMPLATVGARPPRLTPALAPGYAGLALGGAF